MKLKMRMNAWNLKRKISFFLSVMIAATSLIILIISMISAVYYMTEQSKEMAESQLDTLASNYSDTLLQYQKLAMALIVSDSVQTYCKNSSDTGSKYDREAEKVYDDIQKLLNIQNNMNFAVVKKKKTAGFVYKGNSSMLDTRFNIVYEEDYEQSIPMREGSTMRMSFDGKYFRSGIPTLTIYHPVYSISSARGGETGMLIIYTKDSMLEQLYPDREHGEKPAMFLADTGGSMLFSSSGESGTLPYASRIRGKSGSFRENGTLINYRKVGDWNYYLIHEIPMLELYRGSLGVMAVLMLVIIGMMVFSIAALRKIINSFYRPMDKVVAAMDDVTDGRLDGRIDLESMDADSKKLAEGFNSMMNKIRMLMEQVKQEQHQQEQIRLNALYAQIKPHFLYNTLDCIHWQAVTDGNEEISTMVKAMAQYYRVCLSRGKEIIALKQELEHIKSYLIIQNMRYDNMIELADFIPETYYEVQIPKMTLQPLIENSIYHGIRMKGGEKGRIVLSIRQVENEVYLSVADDGLGMSETQLAGMNQAVMEYDETFGYGVRNVNRRIELMFGSGYGLHFSKNEEGGVSVEIHLPFHRDEESQGENHV